jgi:ankyrin repeat protein
MLSQNQTSLLDLPIEVLIVMFSFLSPEQIALSARVNKQFKIAAAYNFSWEDKLKKHFLHIYNKVKRTDDINWYAEFCKAYEAEYRVYNKQSKAYKPLPTRIKELFSFVKEGDMANLERNLKLKDLDQTDVNGVSLLDWAKKNNNQALLNCIYKIALKELAITKTDKKKRTILHWAILCHQPVTTIDSLIQQGADINAMAASGFNAFWLAVEQGEAEIVECLINKGAKVNELSPAGATAIFCAIENGRKNVVDVLLKHNADLSIALQEVGIYHKKFNVVVGDTPLHVAIKLGQKEIVQALIKKGADITTITASGLNALWLAAEQGQADIVECLINNGADVNARSPAGATALFCAVENGRKNVVDILLKHNANLSIALQDDGVYHKKFNVVVGDTPLHVASRLGSTAIIASLIGRNASIEATNNQQQKPIDVARKGSGCANALKLLDYLAKVDHRILTKGSDDHTKSFTIFGYKFNFGFSAQKKKDAAEALRKVIFDGADESCLVVHRAALNNGNLKKISQRLLA